MGAYERRDFAAASDAFARGYEIDAAPVFLYTRAQAVRYLGDCRLAVELYDRYLETDPPPSQRDAALQYRAKCSPESPPPRAETTVAPPSPRTMQSTALESSPPPSDLRAVKRRQLDVGLLATGVVVSVGGIALVGVGARAAVVQDSVRVYDEFRDLERTKRLFLAVGVPTLTIGLAAVIVAAVRVHRWRAAGDIAR
jgi:hypothetical protein